MNSVEVHPKTLDIKIEKQRREKDEKCHAWDVSEMNIGREK